jgi:hypothetical protein
MTSLDTHRAKARFFYGRKLDWIVWLLAPLGWMAWWSALSVQSLRAQDGPPTTVVSEVRYRGSGRALARVNDPTSIAALQQGTDDGVRSMVRNVKMPAPRTAAECEQAALAILDDSTVTTWTGDYVTWSDFLPGNASDLFPGDALEVNVPSRAANFPAIVRRVDIAIADMAGEHSQYTIHFANDGASLIAMDFQTAVLHDSLDLVAIANTSVGQTTLADLTEAEITQTSSTQVTIDAGSDPLSGGGFEVRWTDSGWGPAIDRNLVGRFTTRAFTVPRLARVQNYYIRQYDSSSPPKYSRYTAALHLDYPL